MILAHYLVVEEWLTEPSLLAPEDMSLNPVIGNVIKRLFTVHTKGKNIEMSPEMNPVET